MVHITTITFVTNYQLRKYCKTSIIFTGLITRFY